MLQRLFGRPSVAAARRHRPFAKRDSERLRITGDGAFVLPRANPGIRVEPGFCSVEEGDAIAVDVLEAAAAFGYAYDGDTRAAVLDGSGGVERMTEGLVNNVRVTGRVERPELQTLAPWGYGDDFDSSALPPTLRSLAERVATCGHYAVGPMRDLTINVREQSYFQLDPHLDPATDGPDVFILSLGSTAVLTFTPPDGELEAA